MAKLQPKPTKPSVQQKIQRLGQKWGDDPQKILKQLKRITREYETELSRDEIQKLWGTNQQYRLDDIRDARRWFTEEIKKLVANPAEINHRKMSKYTRGQAIVTQPTTEHIGRMFFYQYNPKWREELPYYDIFPLIIMVKPAKKGWYGLNLHYLPPKQREVLLKKLMDVISDVRLDNNTRLKLSYNLLKSTTKYKYFRPCFKQYLSSHIKSTMRPVPFRHWPKAILLPVARFKKASEKEVWAESKRIINGL